MPKLDEQQYEAGREAFKSGATIRSVVEKLNATGDLPGVLESPDDEVATMSFAVGFADALLDRLRSPVTVNIHQDPASPPFGRRGR